jgi:hypothetical protein
MTCEPPETCAFDELYPGTRTEEYGSEPPDFIGNTVWVRETGPRGDVVGPVGHTG